MRREGMKRFGEKFPQYDPLDVYQLFVPVREKGIFEHYRLARESLQYVEDSPFGGPEEGLIALEKEEIPEELKLSVVAVAPTATVYPITGDEEGLAESIKKTLAYFNYYVVELGVNILTGQEYSIPEFLLSVGLRADSQESTAAVAHDLFPKDVIKRVEIVSGKISLNLSKALTFIPSPWGKVASEIASEILPIEINPIEFNWSYDKYEIDAAGRNNYRIYWKIYKTKNVQAFNPLLTVRAKKTAKRISARVTARYRIKSGWFSSLVKATLPREVPIWPPV